MNIIDITEDNIDEYTGYIDPDMEENIGRDYFRGLLVLDEKDEQPVAALIWEYINLEEEDEDTESRIVWIRMDNKAAGEILMDAYTRETANEDVKRSFYKLPVKLKNEFSLLENAGFSAKETENTVINVTLSELSKLPMVKGSAPEYIMPINEVAISQFRKGIAKCAADKRKGILDDLEFLPMNWFDMDVSCCVNINDKVSGFLLVNKTASEKIIVDLFFAYEPDAGSNLLHMMNYSVNTALAKYPGDTIVKLHIHNEMSTALVKKLFPNKKGKPCMVGER